MPVLNYKTEISQSLKGQIVDTPYPKISAKGLNGSTTCEFGWPTTRNATNPSSLVDIMTDVAELPYGIAVRREYAIGGYDPALTPTMEMLQEGNITVQLASNIVDVKGGVTAYVFVDAAAGADLYKYTDTAVGGQTVAIGKFQSDPTADGNAIISVNLDN